MDILEKKQERTKKEYEKALLIADPVSWIRKNCKFKPYDYQIKYLNAYNYWLRVVRKSRQIGMTTINGYEQAYIGNNHLNEFILNVAPSLKQSLIMMDKVYDALNDAKAMGNLIVENKTECEWFNGNKILSLPNNPRTMRGLSPTRVYFDESAHFHNDPDIQAATSPMRLVTKAKFTLLSTPLGKRGLFYDQHKYATNNQGTDKSIIVFDFRPSTICPRIDEKVMLQMIEMDGLSELEAKQEYYGEFIEEVDVLFPMGLLQKNININLELQELNKESPGYYVGIDFAKKRDETVATFLEKQEDILQKKFSIAWQGMDYKEQIGRIKNISQDYPIIACCADQTSVGEPLVEELKEFMSVEGVIFSRPKKLDMVSFTRRLFEEGRLQIPNEKKLIMQLNSIRYETTKDGNMIIKSPEKETIHDDHAWALVLAAYSTKDSAPIGYGEVKKIL